MLSAQVGLLLESKVSIAKFMQAFENVRAVIYTCSSSETTFTQYIIVTSSSGPPSVQTIGQQESSSDAYSRSVVAISIGSRSRSRGRSRGSAYSVWVSLTLVCGGQCRVCHGAGEMCKFAWWCVTCGV